MATGLVATSDITHATPAVFGAHVHNRKCETEIFKQLLDQDIDVLLGGGVSTNRSSCLLAATEDADNDALILQAQNDGYTFVTTKEELSASGNATKLLGLFNDGGLTPIAYRSTASTEPTLEAMTTTALDILEENDNGFFLMVEGSQIDWANHIRNVMCQIKETLDFDNAVRVVRDWIDADEARKENTLLIVVADHETGGFIIDGPYGAVSQSGDTANQLIDKEGNPVVDDDGNPVMAPDLEPVFGSNPDNPTESANHTAVDTVIWSNSPECARAMDNTDLFHIMKDYLEK